MNSPHSRLEAEIRKPVATQERPVPRPAQNTTSLMRKYEVAALMSDQSVRTSTHIAPASPLFENAVSAFARGTIISTDRGPVAVEDLQPGDRAVTVDQGPQTITWIGSTMMVPSAPGQSEKMRRLVRIMADSLGIGRPMPDLLLGPGARLLREKAAYGALVGSTKLFMPIDDFTEALGLIEVTPPSPVRIYHFALERHSAIRAAGLEMESYHPGENALKGLGHNMESLFLSLFPNMADVEAFGPLTWPRASLDVLESLSAA